MGAPSPIAEKLRAGPTEPPRPPIRLAEAQEFIAKTYDCVVVAEKIDLGSTLGRILASDVIAGTDLPRFDASAVDGYAVRAADLSVSAPSTFKIIGRAAAGHPLNVRISTREAARIFTGAAVPAGADHVLMQEDCSAENGWLMASPHDGGRSNIRYKGEDIRRGTIAIDAGQRVTPGHLALAAGLGQVALPVYRPVKVALFSTGDEVQAGDAMPAPGEIIDANRPMLRGLLASLGCRIDDRGVLRDDPETQIDALMLAAQECDLIITTGGMSVGEEDHLSHVISQRGRLEVWRLKIKPGKPVGIGDIDDCPILALPGNPLAAAMTFVMLGTPLIARLGGNQTLLPEGLRLPLAVPVTKRAGRWEAMPARLVCGQGASQVEPLAKKGSAMLTSLAAADGFITLAEEVEKLVAGDIVDFIPLPRR